MVRIYEYSKYKHMWIYLYKYLKALDSLAHSLEQKRAQTTTTTTKKRQTSWEYADLMRHNSNNNKKTTKTKQAVKKKTKLVMGISVVQWEESV